MLSLKEVLNGIVYIFVQFNVYFFKARFLNGFFSNFFSDIPKHGYRRFLVLEVYRREILDNSTAKKAGIEKVLRLFDESDNSEKYCQLRGEWERTEVEHGDIVNIIGEKLGLFDFFFLHLLLPSKPRI